MSSSRLVRSESDRVIAGICGGVADYLGIDAVLVRLAFLLLIPSGGIGIPLYVMLYLIMPTADNVNEPPLKMFYDNLDHLGENVFANAERVGQHPRAPLVGAALIIALGLFLLLNNLGWISGFNLALLGPLLLLGLGIYLLTGR